MTVLFWLLAVISVAAALGMVTARKAVHGALLLAMVMMCLAVLYAAQDAPFLFAVQVVVYTGAVLMLFLFVLMLVGVDASDSLVETIRGQRWLAGAAAVLFGALLVGAVGQATLTAPVGLAQANAGGHLNAVADLLFSKYVLIFEATSALLITAVLGAMVLAHRERLTARPTQADLARQRIREYAEVGRHPGQLPPPGTFARHNAIGTPALLPDGTPAPASVSRTLAARGVTLQLPPASVAGSGTDGAGEHGSTDGAGSADGTAASDVARVEDQLRDARGGER